MKLGNGLNYFKFQVENATLCILFTFFKIKLLNNVKKVYLITFILFLNCQFLYLLQRLSSFHQHINFNFLTKYCEIFIELNYKVSDVQGEMSLTSYHNYDQLTMELKTLNEAFPTISRFLSNLEVLIQQFLTDFESTFAVVIGYFILTSQYGGFTWKWLVPSAYFWIGQIE
jgi:hypothetical protein